MVPGMTHRLNGPAPSSGLQPPDRDLLAHSAPPVTHHPPQLPAPSLTSYTGSDVGSQDTSHLGKSTKAATTTKQSSAIPPYMKVPPGILSRGSELSLPDLAAQLTCMFWFEASLTLALIENTRTGPPPAALPLVSEAVPSPGFRQWVSNILSMTQVSQNVILLALLFILRLKKHTPGIKGKMGSEFRLFTVALMLGNKFLDDNTYTNKTWADVSGISVQEIHVMEVEFLSNMRYALYASHAEWQEWHYKLNRFAAYYDDAVSLPLAYQAPVLNLPSPPVSHQGSPNAGRMQDSEANPWSRKRSLEDNSLEPMAKRAGKYASSTPVEGTSYWDSSLSGPPVRTPSLYPRIIYPHPSSSHPHRGSLPPLQPIPFQQTRTPHFISPLSYQAASPSPKSTYPLTTSATPIQQSPSSMMPLVRTSPYKPVRRVNTLLVPPALSSIQHAPQQLAYHQMRYQSLGRPLSERHVGVLPLHSFPTWSDQAHQLQHHLPPPPG